MKHPTVYSGKNPTPAIRNLPPIEMIMDQDDTVYEYVVLDLGAGIGRNALHMSKVLGYKVIASDLNVPDEEEQLYPIQSEFDKKKHYDLITLNYVFNVATLEEQEALLELLNSLSWSMILIEVRNLKEIEKYAFNKNWKLIEVAEWGVGYETSKGTYQMGFRANALEHFKEKLGSSREFVKTSPTLAMFFIR